jgi:phage terminase small subunit
MALTAKQEAFCHAIVQGMGPSDAYRAAYNAGKMKAPGIAVNASKLLADTNVALMIESLRKPVVEALQYDLKAAMLEAADALEVSKSKENGGAMVAAVTLRAKLSGLLVEKKEIKVTSIQQMDDSQLIAFVERKAKEAGVNLH